MQSKNIFLKKKRCLHSVYNLTFASGVLFSTQISSAGFSVGLPDAGTGGIPGGKSIPGGGGRFPMGGGRKGGLYFTKERPSN